MNETYKRGGRLKPSEMQRWVWVSEICNWNCTTFRLPMWLLPQLSASQGIYRVCLRGDSKGIWEGGHMIGLCKRGVGLWDGDAEGSRW